MNVLLTYDIKKTTETIHQELKDKLKGSYGYSDQIISDQGKRYDLPNTTLQKPNTTSQQASRDFISACGDVKAKWEKYISVEFHTSTFDNQ